MKITLNELKKLIKEEIETSETHTLTLDELRIKEPDAFNAYVLSNEDEFWYDEGVLMTSDGDNDYMFTDGEWQLVEYED